MNYNRRSIRLKGFDYSNNGYYFVTICVQNRNKLFGDVVGAGLVPAQNNIIGRPQESPVQPKMILNDVGKMVDEIIINYFDNNFLKLDIFQIMPDHIHMIVVINDNRAGTTNRATTRVAPTMGKIIGEIKSIITNEYIKNTKLNNWPKFEKRIWQRNYFERIIRNEKEYFVIKKYIEDNPKKWKVN